MPDELEPILRLLAEGAIDVDEASELIDAMEHGRRQGRDGPPGAPPSSGTQGMAASRARHLRLSVTERGRRVVDLRVPLSLAGAAAAVLPGLSRHDEGRIRSAIAEGRVGTILDVDGGDGDAVLVSLE